MHSPILTERPSEEGQHVLVLEEADLAIDHWFSTIFVEVVRASSPEQPNITYKIHLTVYCQVLDLIVAFEQYLVGGIIRPRLYYNDSQISRDDWLGEGINGETLILAEEGVVMRGEGAASMEVHENSQQSAPIMRFVKRPFVINLNLNVPPPPPPGTNNVEEDIDIETEDHDIETSDHAISQQKAYDSFQEFVSEVPVLDNTEKEKKSPPSSLTKPEEQKKEEPPPEVQPEKKKGRNARLSLGKRAKKAKMGGGGGPAAAVKQLTKQPAEKVINIFLGKLNSR